MSVPLLLACSPRPGGNTATMATHVAQGLGAGSGAARLLFLRDTPIAPCTGCNACRDTGRCILPDSPAVTALHECVRAAPALFVFAPVYFYHLPAQLKAFVDRAQYLWQGAAPTPREATRPAWLGMVAGRARGKELFSGSERTLRCFLALCGFHLQGSLFLRGYDDAGALAADAAALERCRALGVQAREHLAAHTGQA